MNEHEIALALAIARHESGFNPEAAAGRSSASGLGQMTDDTARAYGLNESNRWNVDRQASALVHHTLDNAAWAKAHGHDGADLDRYTYAYHHDGPQLRSGGLAIGDKKVMPLVDLYQRYVESLGDQHDH